ncbi:MAG: phytoene desaturase family protein [Pseudomonadota bacterium]
MNIHSKAPRLAGMVATDDDRPHAVVIGTGFGGLAAGVRLGARGYRVTLIDAMDRIGGRAAVTEQDGFVFDGGPTIITAPVVYEELWDLCGKRMEDHVSLKSLNPFYSIRFDNGDVYRCFANEDEVEAEIKRFSPDDLPGYHSFLAEAEKCFKAGYEKMIDTPFLSLKDMAFALPDLIARRADRSIHKLAAKHIKDHRLRMALSFHPLFIGGNPLKTSSVMSLISHMERIWGVHFTMGGTGALAEGIADLVRDQGGVFRLAEKVDEILVTGGSASGVRLASGETIEADIVVSNAEPGHTYKHLLAKQKRKRWTDRKVDRAKYSMSLFVWYLGTSERFEDVDLHTIILGPRYRGLLEDIFDKKHLAEDFSLYLYRPTAEDPSLAPEGCDTFYVLAPVPNLEGTTDWESFEEEYKQKVAERLEMTVMPGFTDKIVTSKVVTPLHFRDNLHSTKGAAFGMQPLITQLAWFRPHNKSEEIENLYLVGAGTHPGAGVPAVVSSAKILDKIVPHANELAARN